MVGGPAYYAYCDNYLIDLEVGTIVYVEASAVNKAADASNLKAIVNRIRLLSFQHNSPQLVVQSRFVGLYLLGSSPGSATTLGKAMRWAME